LFKRLFDERDVLDTGKLGVESLGREQLLVVRATFDDLAMVEDQDDVGVPNGAQPMSDDKAGPAGHQALQALPGSVVRWRYRRWQWLRRG
jgi:hypothetical protein